MLLEGTPLPLTVKPKPVEYPLNKPPDRTLPLHRNTGETFSIYQTPVSPNSPLAEVDMTQNRAAVAGDAKAILTARKDYRGEKGPKDEELLDANYAENTTRIAREADDTLPPGVVQLVSVDGKTVLRTKDPKRVLGILQKSDANDPGVLRIVTREPDYKSTTRIALGQLGKDVAIKVDTQELKPEELQQFTSSATQTEYEATKQRIAEKPIVFKTHQLNNENQRFRQEGKWYVDRYGFRYLPIEGKEGELLQVYDVPEPVLGLNLANALHVFPSSGSIHTLPDAIISVSSTLSSSDVATTAHLRENPSFMPEWFSLAQYYDKFQYERNPNAKHTLTQETSADGVPTFVITMHASDGQILQIKLDENKIRESVAAARAKHQQEQIRRSTPSSENSPATLITDTNDILPTVEVAAPTPPTTTNGEINTPPSPESVTQREKLQEARVDKIAKVLRRIGNLPPISKQKIAAGLGGAALMLLLTQSAPLPKPYVEPTAIHAPVNPSADIQTALQSLTGIAYADLGPLPEPTPLPPVTSPPEPTPPPSETPAPTPPTDGLRGRGGDLPPLTSPETAQAGDSIWKMLLRRVQNLYPNLPEANQTLVVNGLKNLEVATDGRPNLQPGDMIELPGEGTIRYFIDCLGYSPTSDTPADMALLCTDAKSLSSPPNVDAAADPNIQTAAQRFMMTAAMMQLRGY